MKNLSLNEIFIEAVKQKLPNQQKIANVLMDLLNIEREAVYRRLRNDVAFTFVEIVTVSRALSISLDDIVGLNNMCNPFQLQMIDYIYPNKTDYSKMENYINLLEHIIEDPLSELVEVSNSIPETLFLDYKYIAKYYLLKWDYHYHFGPHPIRKFHELNLEDAFVELQKAHSYQIKRIKSTCYIIDNNLFSNLVYDIKSLASLNCISEKDVEILKMELFDFLDYMENLAIEGYYPKTKSQVLIYISDLSIDSNYGYIKSDVHKISLLRMFSLNAMSSIRESSFENMKNWIDSFKRFSTLISVSGEKLRFAFFERQRAIVSTL